MTKGIFIRERWRLQASPPAGRRQSWAEYQVVLGRKVLARCDTRKQAEDRAVELAVALREKADHDRPNGNDDRGTSPRAS